MKGLIIGPSGVGKTTIYDKLDQWNSIKRMDLDHYGIRNKQGCWIISEHSIDIGDDYQKLSNRDVIALGVSSNIKDLITKALSKGWLALVLTALPETLSDREDDRISRGLRTEDQRHEISVITKGYDWVNDIAKEFKLNTIDTTELDPNGVIDLIFSEFHLVPTTIEIPEHQNC